MSVHAWPGGRGAAFLCRLSVAAPSVAAPSVAGPSVAGLPVAGLSVAGLPVGDDAAATVGVRLRR